MITTPTEQTEERLLLAVSKSIAAKLPFKREQSELARGLPSGRPLSKSCISIVVIFFLRFEDCRIGKDHARTYLVKKHVGRSSAAVTNYLYDNSAYVLGYSDKAGGKEQLSFDTFKAQIENIAEAFPDSNEILAVRAFYNNSREEIIQTVSQDPLWEDIQKNLSKKYSTFSFRIEGDKKNYSLATSSTVKYSVSP